ncbi:MAG: CBS domain-containing protein [Sulfuricellaceae bacterium]|jgi:CBS domain-containing protein
MIIREILASKKSGKIYSIAPERYIHEAVALMTEHDIGSLVVMDGDKMVGLLTDRCVVRGLSKSGCDVCGTRVSDVMSDNPVVGHPDDPVDLARRKMIDSHTNHLPVADEKGLVGIISFFDVARTALSEAEFENKLLKGYIKNWPEA